MFVEQNCKKGEGEVYVFDRRLILIPALACYSPKSRDGEPEYGCYGIGS